MRHHVFLTPPTGQVNDSTSRGRVLELHEYDQLAGIVYLRLAEQPRAGSEPDVRQKPIAHCGRCFVENERLRVSFAFGMAARHVVYLTTAVEHAPDWRSGNHDHGLVEGAHAKLLDGKCKNDSSDNQGAEQNPAYESH
jgi:hypothetical protein